MKRTLFLFVACISLSLNLFGQTNTVAMTKRDGIFYIPCKVNGLALEFIFDTGASDVTISLTEALFMLKNHYLSDDDIIGGSSAQLANGEITKTTMILLKEIDIAGVKLFNINASIVNKLEAPLLLGQTAMSKLGRFQIDPNSGTITIYKTLETQPLNTHIVESDKLEKDNLDTLKAIENYTHLISLTPKDERAYFSRGYAKIYIKDYKGAIEDCSKAISINPNYAKAYYYRGLMKGALKDCQGAIMDCSKAISINSNYAEAYCFRGLMKGKLEDFQGVKNDCTQAIVINPNDAQAYYYRGYAKGKLNDYHGAIKDCSKAISINPNYAEAYCFRGLAKLNLNDKKGACLDLSKAGELGSAEAYDFIRQFCK